MERRRPRQPDRSPAFPTALPSINALTAPSDSRRDHSFLEAGGTPDQYHAALARAISKGWLWLHESGTYVKFTPAGAEMFA
jgi:hypothetical protein